MNLTESNALNSRFADFGFNSKNFLLNSGSYFEIEAGIIVFFLLKFIVVRLSVAFSKFRCCRSIGMYF